MANIQERGTGQTITPPAPTVSRTPPPKKSIAKKRTYRPSTGGSNSRRSSSGDNYRRASISRRASGSSSSRNRAPSSPPSGSSKVVKPAAPPKPAPPPGNATWLRSDSTYQRQLAAYAKALSDFQAEQGLSRTDYDTNYQNTRRDIGLAQTEAAGDLQNDYAARGLLKSNLYSTALGDLNSQYRNQYTDLDKQRTAFLDSLAQQFTGYKNDQSVQQQNAMNEALRRRAERYNL